MNDSAENIEMLKDILVDPDFESVCPPLTEDEFSLLEQNILSDGEVTSPLIVWDNKLIDGHHRRQIILKHPELPFQIKEVAFNNKYEAIAWICKNQAGRRNLTSEQLSYDQRSSSLLICNARTVCRPQTGRDFRSSVGLCAY